MKAISIGRSLSLLATVWLRSERSPIKELQKRLADAESKSTAVQQQLKALAERVVVLEQSPRVASRNFATGCLSKDVTECLVDEAFLLLLAGA
jgi:hypothetical protein